MELSLSGSSWSKNAARTAFISLAIAAFLLIPVFVVAGQNSDYSLSANPQSLCVNPGVNGKSVISVSSEGGFADTVSLAASVSTNTAGSPTVSGVPSSVTLTSGQTITFELTISTTSSTPIYVYYVTVQGLSGSSYHTATIQLTVAASCSVGGIILPTNQPASLAPYFAIAALTAAVAGLATGVFVYRTRRK